MGKASMRIWSLLLAFSMVFNMLPLHAIAAEIDANQNNSSTETKESPSDQGLIDDVYIIEEIVENRTEYVKEFRLSNGLHMASVYANPVHYEVNGQWEEIDNTLRLSNTRTGNAYTNTAGVWQVSFPQSMTEDNGVTITKDGYVFNFQMAGEILDDNIKDISVESEIIEIPIETEEPTVVEEETVPAEGNTFPAEEPMDVPEETVIPEETEAIEATMVPEENTTEPAAAEEETVEASETEATEAATEVEQEAAEEETDDTDVQESSDSAEEKPSESTEPQDKVVLETVAPEAEAQATEPATEETVLVSVPEDNVTAEIESIDMEEIKAQAEYPETVIEKISSRLSYDGIYEDTEIIFDLNSNQVKESIVLNTYRESLKGYIYALEVGELTPVLLEGGGIELRDANGEEVIMYMPAPYLIDAAGAACFDINISLEGENGKYVLAYELPREWLADSRRQWPVVLDPIVQATATTNNVRDIAVYSNTYLGHENGVLQCGNYSDWGVGRIYLKYNELPALSSSDVIVAANVTLFTSTTSIVAPQTVEVHKVTDTWASETITWSNKPAPVDTVEDYQICKNTQTYYTWDITDIARGWYEGENTGMMFKVDDESEASTSNTRVQFYSSDYGVVYKPTVLIMFRNNNGLEGYWDYSSSTTTRAGVGYVNQYTGNLVWVHEDMGFGGNRMPVTINHVYNANDSDKNTFGMGYGWRTNFNQLVYAWDDANAVTGYYIWEDGDGTKHYFQLDEESGEYLDEDGMELTLTDTGTDSKKYCISDKYGNCSYFDANGRLRSQSNNQKTKSTIVITYTSSTSKRIATVKDGAGRMYYFTYADNLLSQLDYKGTNENTILRTVTYTYTSSKLTKISYMDGEYASFTYFDTTSTNTKRLLKEVTDIDGYALSYTYNARKDGIPARISSVTESDGSASGGKLTFEYARNQTTVTDRQGNVQRMQFNTWGNRISVQDGQGRAQYAGFETDKGAATAKGNQLTLSSQMQNTVGNRIKNSNFDLDNLWNTSGETISCAIVSGTAYSGNRSMKLTATANATNPYVYASGYSVEANSSVTFSAYIKTGEAPTYLSINDGSSTVRSDVLKANSDWTRLQVTYHNNTAGSKTVTIRIPMNGPGISYVDCVQMENAASASRFNLVGNGDFRHANAYWSSDNGRTTLSGKAAPELSTNVYRIIGSPTAKKRITQTIPISGAKGDNFVLAGWAKAYSVQLSGDREFGVLITFNRADGTTQTEKIHFNPSVDSWQYVCGAVVASKAYESITITVAYDYNANTAYFDGIQLYKEVFGTSYEYDADGNVVKSTDVQKQSTTCTYDDDQNLESISMPTGESVTYTYDDYHNVLTATTGTGVVYTYGYDAYGNTKSVTITDSSSGKSISASAEYSDGGNRLVSSTDALGQTTTYSYTANTNVLDYVLYPNDTAATKTDYSYDLMYRMLTGVTTTTDTGLTLSASYEYTDDLLTKLSTPSTDYTFTYGNFGLRTKVKAGSLTLASYTYEDATNYLKKLAYGNGDSVEYTYNQQGQVTGQTYEDGDVVTYHYGNSGELASVTDSDSGITQHYIYDLIGRPGQYRETGGAWEVNQTYTYSSKNQLTRIKETIGDRTCTTAVAYDSEGRVSTYRKNNSRVTYSYDDLDRLSSMVTHHTYGDGKDILTETYEYTDPITGKTSGRVSEFTTKSIGNYDVTYEYSYDGNGNIVSVKNDGKTTTYTYDTANQLLRENNQAAGKTWVYTYDNAGNILTKKEYAYTTGTLGTATSTVTYGYTHATWGDLLKEYKGTTLTYDYCGNMLNGHEWRYTWEHGRQLASMAAKDGSATWNFTYNADGLRTSRTNGTTTYKYQYLGGQLVKMTVDDKEMYFNYDASGVPVSIVYNGTTYYYVTNLQGDIVGIVNQSGNQIVGYTYDAWGNILTTTGSSANTLGKYNPLRYRGYVYDTETRFYYLQSRYYDPEIGRFINADSYASTGQGVLGNNMFAYCLNNPVSFEDPFGELTQGEIHNLVLDHIITKKKKEGRNTLSNSKTCIYYNCVDFWGGWGFCDLYDTDTGEVWELKKYSSSYTCTTAYASRQLDRYVSGRLKHMPNLKLIRGGTLLEGKTGFSFTDSSGTYNIVYWEEGNGILRYSYSFSKNKSKQANDAMLLLMCSIAVSSPKSGGRASVISFSDDIQNAA